MGSMGSLHAGQRDAGHTTDLRRGTRWITTFRKLPTTRPSRPAARTIKPHLRARCLPASPRHTSFLEEPTLGKRSSRYSFPTHARHSTSSRKRETRKRVHEALVSDPFGSWFPGLLDDGPQDLLYGGDAPGSFYEPVLPKRD